MKKAGIKVYFQIIKTQLIRSMTYKFDVYGNILMQTVIMLASAFFWKAILKSGDEVGGISVDTMMTYTVVSSLISILLGTNVERRITESVQKGTIAIDMMRPINLFGVFLAEDIAGVIALFFQNMIPVFAVGSLLVGIPIPASGISFVLFLVSVFMAFCINWLMAVLFGMISFETINMDALIQVKKHLIRLLSGSIIPLWFFPEALRNILECLPFAYLYQLPLDIYIGNYTPERLYFGLTVQFIWTVLLLIAFLVCSRRVLRKVMIQGG